MHAKYQTKYEMKRLLLLSTFLVMTVCMASAQELTVKSMNAELLDLSASTNPRLDKNGNACGLVKVRLATTGAVFSGNVLGEVENHAGEYWVYMSQGSYMLKVRHPEFIALDVNFRDYGIRGVEPKTTYVLTLLLPQVLSGTAGRFSLKINPSFSSGFSDDGWANLLPQWRLGQGSDTLTVYRNLRNGQYDQLYTIKPDGLINNLNTGDVLTIFPANESFEPFSATITDSILEKNEIKCVFEKKKSSLHGYVIDDYSHKPVKDCTVLLYLGSYKDIKKPNNFLLSGWGYEKYFETNEAIGTFSTDNNGYFGWKDCVIDYTHYISARPPRGYASIELNAGVNMKPKDCANDSLIIRIRPTKIKGIVTNGKAAIPNVEIECETLYGERILTTGQDGSFEIIGLTSEFVRFKHHDFRVMDIKLNNLYYNKDNITIAMKKGNRNMPYRGEYNWGKIKEIK